MANVSSPEFKKELLAALADDSEVRMAIIGLLEDAAQEGLLTRLTSRISVFCPGHTPGCRRG